jgi:arylsulfatase A-like enzyme
MTSAVIIVADSLRYDALGCMGGEARTPTVDRMASESTMFERTISAAPWTVPSIASMLTGVYSHRLGLAKWEQPWPGEYRSLFASAARAGLRVASFVFDTAHLFRRVREAGVAGSSQDTDSLIRWIEENRNEPFLLFIHYWWTHIPYVDKPMTMSAWKQTSDRVLEVLRSGDAARKGVQALYLRAVERFSEIWLPRVFDVLDMDATWTVLTSDHGESWGERRETSKLADVFDLHGNTLYDEVLRVPLIIRPPGGSRSRRIRQLVRTVDLAPTVSDLMGLDEASRRSSIDGVSLAECIQKGAHPPELDAVSVMNRDFVDLPDLPGSPNELWNAFALTTKRYKYIWRPQTDMRQLFDLDVDPGETQNIPVQELPDLESGWARLTSEHARAKVGEVMPEDVEKIKQRLRNLGYLE